MTIENEDLSSQLLITLHCTPPRMLGKKLGKNRIRIIELIVSNPNITYSELSEALSVSSTTIENRIAEMSDVIIKRVGPKNGGHWEVIEN